jgi:hypothetical protein
MRPSETAGDYPVDESGVPVAAEPLYGVRITHKSNASNDRAGYWNAQT